MQKLFLKISNFADNNLKYAVASIIFAVVLYPKFPFINIPGTQVAIRLEDFLIVIAVAVWSLAILPSWKKLLHNKAFQAVMLFWLVGLLSVATGVLLTKNIAPHIGILHWARRVEYMIMLFIGMHSVKNRDDLRFYIKSILLVIFFAFVYGVGQKYYNWPIITTQNSEYAKGLALRYMPGAHIVSTFAGHYDLASYLVLILPLVITLIFAPVKLLKKLFNHSKVIYSKLFVSAFAFSGLWLLVNAASRISIASYLGGAVIALFLVRKYKIIPIIIVISIMFIGFSSNLIDRYTRIFEFGLIQVIDRSSGLIDQTTGVYAAEDVLGARRVNTATPAPKQQAVFEDRSTSIRFNVEWPRAIRAFSKNPILGTGYSSITLATDNDYLRMIGEIGLLGISAFLLVIARIFTELAKIFPRPKDLDIYHVFTLSILGALPGVALNMVFIDILEASKFAIMFWLFVGFAIKSSQLSKHEKN